MYRWTLGVTLVTLIGGCGGSSGTTSGITAYRQLGGEVTSSLDTHCTTMASMTDAAACPAERDRYSAEVTPMLDRMTSMSSDMDACMSSMGHASSADMHATCQSMQTELHDHLAAACVSGDLATEQAEARRHCDAMNGMMTTEMQRAGMLSTAMMGSGGMMSGGSCHF